MDVHRIWGFVVHRHRSRSVALAAFGADSAIELLSAATVLWSFRTGRQRSERTAAKLTGWLLIGFVVYIAACSLYALVLHRKAEASYLGMVVLFAAAVVMPWLGRQKRRLAAAANSSALGGRMRLQLCALFLSSSKKRRKHSRAVLVSGAVDDQDKPTCTIQRE